MLHIFYLCIPSIRGEDVCSSGRTRKLTARQPEATTHFHCLVWQTCSRERALSGPSDLPSLVHHLSFTLCASGSLTFFPFLEYVLTPTYFKALAHAIPSAPTSLSLSLPAFHILSSSHPSNNASLAFVLGFVRAVMLFPQDQLVSSKHLQPIWLRKKGCFRRFLLCPCWFITVFK